MELAKELVACMFKVVGSLPAGSIEAPEDRKKSKLTLSDEVVKDLHEVVQKVGRSIVKAESQSGPKD